MIGPAYLGLAYGASEIALALARRSKRAEASSRDAGTLRAVWLVIAVSLAAAIWVARKIDFGRYHTGDSLLALALVLFAAGLALRWWAILSLGRFFTVDVAIHTGHELVERGPYRVLRHPSYTGALLAFVALGLTFGSWPALALATLPVLAVLLWRMRVEERALAGHFGEAWRAYAARTWRLLPGVW
jgi:protein-S-isoprenylcysteine O-methyltransferase